MAPAIVSLSRYLPVPTMRREWNVRPPTTNGVSRMVSTAVVMRVTPLPRNARARSNRSRLQLLEHLPRRAGGVGRIPQRPDRGDPIGAGPPHFAHPFECHTTDRDHREAQADNRPEPRQSQGLAVGMGGGAVYRPN